MELQTLIDMNPWWDLGEVPLKLRKEHPRSVFYTLQKLMETRQILSLVGLRRTGKTTLMYQLIQKLIDNGISPRNILYFSFDVAVKDIKELVSTYIDMVPGIKNGKIYLFLDEIQKLDNWTNKIKLLYDLNPDYKFVLSGSASLEIAQKGGESLAGRIIKININVLDFPEYLLFASSQRPVALDGSNLEEIYKEYAIHEKTLLQAFKDAVIKGGLIETINMDNVVLKYFLISSIVDNIVIKDIPNRYPIDNPQVLKEILRSIALNPGIFINYDQFAHIFNMTRQTISKYIRYLEDSFVISTKYNFSGSFISSVRKMKRIYLVHPSLCMAFLEDELQSDMYGRLVENYIIQAMGFEFFYRRNGREIDAITRYKGRPIPIEIKYTSSIDSRTFRVINAFIRRFNSPYGIVLTKDVFLKKGKVICIPAIFFMLLPYRYDIIQKYVKQ